MRITPLTVWLSQLTDQQEMKKAIVTDVQFTHPNQLVHQAVFLYSSAISVLLQNPNDPERALKAFNHVLALS